MKILAARAWTRSRLGNEKGIRVNVPVIFELVLNLVGGGLRAERNERMSEKRSVEAKRWHKRRGLHWLCQQRSRIHHSVPAPPNLLRQSRQVLLRRLTPKYSHQYNDPSEVRLRN
jgi:hypothetical protein